ncbi:uncharacterized protein LOC130622587 [Hydractinia symbiolongicarpus]|uniref:uncharacterized protein LOC130622587 n=1 Tax=Hydractinia symbiolongicarpus TaxID=13093 RepID=UPI00254DD1A3|nr:uncharacterized protein LOC130622587 [Hydractinia symbiolongicarpus]
MAHEAVLDEITGYNTFYLSLFLKHCFQMDNYLLKHSTKLRKRIEKEVLWSAALAGQQTTVLTGSSAEGLCLPLDKTGYILMKSDLDHMIVLDYIKVHALPNECVASESCFYPYTTADVYPGYCLVQQCNPIRLLSSSEIRKQMIERASQIHPDATASETSTAITFSQSLSPKFNYAIPMYADIIYSLKHETWPDHAKEWITRERKSNWPSQKQIKKIVKSGCHLVPKSHPLSRTDSTEWRYSFSITAELPLSLTYSKIQRFCYLIVKLLIKHAESLYPEFLVSTYYIKTCMFWISEETPQPEWNERLVGKNVFRLLDKLIDFISKRNLPNYFIPENNMILHWNEKSDEYKKSLLLLKHIRKYPVHTIMKCKTYQFYSENVMLDLFPSILDALCSSSVDYNRILLALMRVATRHNQNAEFGLAIPACEDILYFYKKKMGCLDTGVLCWIVLLANCYSRVGNLAKYITTNWKILELLENNPDSELADIGSMVLNQAQAIFTKALSSNPTAYGSLDDVRELFLISETFFNLSDQRRHAVWCVHYANFCVRMCDFTTARTLLEKHLNFLVSTKCIEDDVLLAPCESVTIDSMMQNIFEVKKELANTLRFDYDRYPDCFSLPTIIWALYLLIEVCVELNDFENVRLHLSTFRNFVETHMPAKGMKPTDWYSLLGHSYIRIDDLNNAKYFFKLRYPGPNLDKPMNAYHDVTLEFHRLALMYQCFK